MFSFITPLRAVIGGIAIAAGLLMWHLWGELETANKTIGEQKSEIRGLQADLISAAETTRKQQQTIADLQDVSKARAEDAAELSNRVGSLQSKLSQLARESDKPGVQQNREVSNNETTCNFYRNGVPEQFLDLMRDAARAANGNSDQASTDPARSWVAGSAEHPAARQADDWRSARSVHFE